MRLLALALALVPATPAAADVPRALDTVLLPSIARFAEAAQALERGAATDCSRTAVLPLYHAARDAWGSIGDIRLGPTEAAALTIAFWPDDRGSGMRALRAALVELPPDASILPASARGFPALDLMLGDPGLTYGIGEPGCMLVSTLTTDLAAQAEALQGAWADYARLLRYPGGPGNTAYLDETEALRALMTQALAAIEVTATARLGRPLGEPGRPRPARAEAWRTERSLPNVLASLRSAVAIARALAVTPLPRTESALAAVERAATAIRDPGLQDIADRNAQFRLEVLQQRVTDLHAAMVSELGGSLGLAPGFNALDGD
ncbi:imelysin family protein [Plastorhodobacter daqingensis]|uniref:Imelysin family protein n=1 Tax=Plastorhodobacter daqingensis TaxID=1387281 RepID=A0ABW2ULK5_9RHOB